MVVKLKLIRNSQLGTEMMLALTTGKNFTHLLNIQVYLNSNCNKTIILATSYNLATKEYPRTHNLIKTEIKLRTN